MSDKVALVALERVIASIRREVSVDDRFVEKMAKKGNIPVEQAKGLILASFAKKALRMTRGDERLATTALVIVNGRTNRIPQCVKLLRKHTEATVRVAYEIKSELAIADASLRSLCVLISMTDEDMEGEAHRLRDLLEQIAMKSISDQQEWFFHEVIRQRLEQGILLETIEDEIMERIEHPWKPPVHSGISE